MPCHRKATGSLKYFHDKYNVKTNKAEHDQYVDSFDEAVQYNDQLGLHVKKVSLLDVRCNFLPAFLMA